MPKLLPDVSFPIFRGGATAALTDRLRLRLLSLSGTTIDDGWSCLDFTAPYWRIYLNLDEGVETTCRGRVNILRAGHLYVIPAWLCWSGRCRGRVRHLNASVDLMNFPRDRVSVVASEVYHLGGPGQPLSDAWMRLGRELSLTTVPGAAQVARGYALAYEAISDALSQVRDANTLISVPDEALLADVIAIIERDLSRPLPVTALARIAGCSSAELARRFRTVLGTSPARWVRQRRIAVAADLLRCTTDRIEAIALRCGFSDRSRFSKTFRSSLGCGPATWRRRSRGEWGSQR
ncbi:MAG: helix-turn-helix transcriptional regulator [Planctomycetes bacterium]|nr:helix-turn-helix transcriptional regulator [Planctomycetota bacterium]